MAPASNDAPPSSSGAKSKVASAWLATQSTCVAIGTLLVLTRIYVRSIIVRKLGLDDILIAISLVRNPT